MESPDVDKADEAVEVSMSIYNNVSFNSCSIFWFSDGHNYITFRWIKQLVKTPVWHMPGETSKSLLKSDQGMSTSA